jgi:predicted lipoprotein with Yx(FWY)xxD motif
MISTLCLFLAPNLGCERQAEQAEEKVEETAEEARKTAEEAGEGVEETAREAKEATEEAAAEMMGEEEATVAVRMKEGLGEYLVDSKGMSLYMFRADEGQKGSACENACAEAWPPLMAEGDLTAGKDLDQDKLGTIERKDGKMQVTYAGWPLYHFKNDAAPGDTKGQDMKGFGAEWYLMSPAGEKVEAEAEAEEEGSAG